MKPAIPELEKLELNQQNVMRVLAECRPTAQTEIIANASIYSRHSVRKSPIVQLDLKKAYTYRCQLWYFLGQLMAVHENRQKMTPGEGLINYKGERWTEDNRAVLALFDLAITTELFPLFADGDGRAESGDLSAYYAKGLKPTVSPSDPAFELKSAVRALKEMGVSV